jgi:hypothetical protein
MDDGRTPLWRETGLAGLGVVIAAAATLLWMGRRVWCAQGDWAPWSFDIWSAHNSQHVVDPYTFTHVLHGVVFFAGLRLLGARWPDLRLLLAIVLESAWEVVENTERVIQHYREATISLDYTGDTVVNSVADVAAMVCGYLIASRVPWWASVLLFVGTELVLAWWIRDSLTLNVIMLFWPIEAIKTWQTGG